MKTTATELTDDLFRRLDGTEAERSAGVALLLCTVDANGFPHPAMLSYFEVAAVDRRNIRLALYGDSRTSAHLRAGGRATLILADERFTCHVKGTGRQMAGRMASAPFNAMFTLSVEQVTFDEVSAEREPGVSVTHGIGFQPRYGEAHALAQAVLRELQASGQLS